MLGKRQEHFSRSLYFSYHPSNMQMNFYYTLLQPLLTVSASYLYLHNYIFLSRCSCFFLRFISSQILSFKSSL